VNCNLRLESLHNVFSWSSQDYYRVMDSNNVVLVLTKQKWKAGNAVSTLAICSSWPIWSYFVKRIENMFWSTSSPFATRGGALVGLAPQTKLQAPPNRILKHYKLVEFLSNLNVNPLCTNVQPPAQTWIPPIDDFLATVLSTSDFVSRQYALKLCRFLGAWQCISDGRH